MHVVLAVQGKLRFEVANESFEAAGVVTAPDVVHRIDARGVEVLLVFLDPESAAGAALSRVVQGPARAITEAERDALIEGAAPRGLMQGDGVAWAERAAKTLGGGTLPARRVHPGVRRALAHLRETGFDADTSLEALAGVAGLSEGRFMHAFTESVGIPLRPYLAWLKLQRAAAAIAAGRSFTEAAHAAGFTDSAHLTRSFVRMFGMRPRDLRAAIEQPADTRPAS
ncbi:MAG: helix-turn-helix transcriptional regulator [Polyangiaceae bacterium]|nr:helix-turn-helix transcriptional regulator [Polyangiaceae bacterium]